LASSLCKVRGEKHLWAFVKVADGSEMCKFGINILTPFSSKFWRKLWSNSAKPNQNAPECTHERSRPACHVVTAARRRTARRGRRRPPVHAQHRRAHVRDVDPLVGATRRTCTLRLSAHMQPLACWPVARRHRLVPILRPCLDLTLAWTSSPRARTIYLWSACPPPSSEHQAPPPWRTLSSAHSRCRPTPLASPLGPTQASTIACCPAPPLPSSESRLQRPRRHGLVVAAHRRPLLPSHYHPSTRGELNLTPVAFVALLRPSLATDELASVARGIAVKAQIL
jgi:hypothetical protein